MSFKSPTHKSLSSIQSPPLLHQHLLSYLILSTPLLQAPLLDFLCESRVGSLTGHFLHKAIQSIAHLPFAKVYFLQLLVA